MRGVAVVLKHTHHMGVGSGGAQLPPVCPPKLSIDLVSINRWGGWVAVQMAVDVARGHARPEEQRNHILRAKSKGRGRGQRRQYNVDHHGLLQPDRCIQRIPRYNSES